MHQPANREIDLIVRQTESVGHRSITNVPVSLPTPVWQPETVTIKSAPWNHLQNQIETLLPETDWTREWQPPKLQPGHIVVVLIDLVPTQVETR